MKLANYPNPFNPITNISFDLLNNNMVELSIYNINGQRINTLLKKALNKGNHSIVWNGTDYTGKSVTSGLYFYILKINNKFKIIKKCTLLK